MRVCSSAGISRPAEGRCIAARHSSDNTGKWQSTYLIIVLLFFSQRQKKDRSISRTSIPCICNQSPVDGAQHQRNCFPRVSQLATNQHFSWRWFPFDSLLEVWRWKAGFFFAEPCLRKHEATVCGTLRSCDVETWDKCEFCTAIDYFHNKY